MQQQVEDTPPVNPNASSDELHGYFADILPNYDRDRVFTGDIKKVIKWFNFLNETGALQETEDEKATEEEE